VGFSTLYNFILPHMNGVDHECFMRVGAKKKAPKDQLESVASKTAIAIDFFVEAGPELIKGDAVVNVVVSHLLNVEAIFSSQLADVVEGDSHDFRLTVRPLDPLLLYFIAHKWL